MKLNQYHKDAIIRAITNDIPRKTDEQIQAAVQAALVKGMSVACRNLYKKNPKALMTKYISGTLSCRNFEVVSGDANVTECLKPFSYEYIAFEKVERSLKAAINGCTTRKQFVDRFPEFGNYAPHEEGVCKTTPTIANVVADLVKLGFVPKVTK